MSDRYGTTTSALVNALGGASFGLGMSELVAPGKVAAVVGVDDPGRSRGVIRALGARECGHGAVLLAGVAFRGRGRRRQGTISAVVLTGIAGLDLYTALRTTGNGGGRHGRHIDGTRHRTLRAAVTVRRPPEEVYRFWRDLENLPGFMRHLRSVTAGSDGQSHRVASAPAGRSVRWDAQITEDDPDKRIAWQSLPGSAIENGGSVEFTPTTAGDGTEVRVRIGYHIPGGALGKAAATLFGQSPEQQVNDDLRRFKQLMETGQVLRSDGSPEGTTAIGQLHQQPAQPNKGATA